MLQKNPLNPTQIKQKQDSTTLLQTETRKMRQKPVSWGSNWCLSFFISLARLRVLLS